MEQQSKVVRKFVYAVPKSEDEKRAERETKEVEELKQELKKFQDAYEEQYQSTMKFIQKARDALTEVIAVKKENDTLKKRNEELEKRVVRKTQVIREQKELIDGLDEDLAEALKKN